ncbi:MAG: pyruvate/2-oxoglutarate dehydrogenase complex, dihydrolipoamide dehydrogenase component [Rhodospirillales bacterium]|nr:pyruvate/2-oxoglutarate dehydrogenase complex, dihydrolipoamide dehydrogenase component [Rhodospirillales bacterium]
MGATHHDLVVLGSGPAGEKGGAQAAFFGKKVALVERESSFGGAATNTGTLPSKTLRESALYLSGFEKRGLFGINLEMKDRVTARDFFYREKEVVLSEQARITANIEHHAIDVYHGAGSFIDANTVSVTGADGTQTLLTADKFLIATGSSPTQPGNMPFHDKRVFDSDTILQLHDMPETMLVIGGGVIGCEYACMFAALGIKVSLIDGRDRLLGFMDAEISEALRHAMEKLDIDLFLSDTVESIDPTEKLQITLKSGHRFPVDIVLAATGRDGATKNMGLEAIGIAPSNRGLLTVNEHYQTSVPHIYAAGDVIGFPALASTSMEQARIAMSHAFDLKFKERLAPILPYGIYTIPECSMAGETEESLTKASVPYVCGHAYYKTNARGEIIGDRDGFLKLLFRIDDMKLVGVHVIGEQASELVHIGLTALLSNATADLFIATCYNYPTLSEIYKYATYNALQNRLKHMASVRA